jgi:hypothetical protein
MTTLVGLLFLCAAAVQEDHDPCSIADTSASFLSRPLELASCPTAFDSEAALLSASCAEAASHDGVPICLAMRRGWFDAASMLSRLSVSAAGYARVRNFVESWKREATSVVQLLQTDTHTKTALVVPACQWAQNASVVAVAVRFSPKKHGPVSVASVEEPRVLLTERHVSFSATGLSVNGGKKLRFELELPLAHAIDAELSSWKAERSGGRLTMQLIKAEAGEHWPALATPPASDGSGARRGHISTWFEMQQQLGVLPSDDEDD